MSQKITITRGLYETLIAAQKALVLRAGGEVEIPFAELDAASGKTCELRYLGDKDDVENGTWTFTTTDEEPPEEPRRVDGDIEDII